MTPNTLNSWKDKTFVIEEVTRRVLEMERESAASGSPSLEILLNETVLFERDRLKKEGRSKEIRNRLRFWNRINAELPGASETDRENLLRRVVRMYAAEIHSPFNPRIYSLVTRILPRLLKFATGRFFSKSKAPAMHGLNLGEKFLVSGPVDSIRNLSAKATLILAPTHVSNLDSVILGIALHQLRLPPVIYGAGLNLFRNPVLSYILTGLGGYKVDRRKKNSIYKNTLKQYATLSMECGQHNLFFPGGTRNRRGDMEHHLKLGLVGCGLPAYAGNLRRGETRPDIFVVPVTLSYGLVLEAKLLIEEHLREEGKSRFIRVRRIFSWPRKVFRFWRNLKSLNSGMHIRFGEPLDLFGNTVDENGVSHDPHGRVVNRIKYLEVNGTPTVLAQRDREYTRELGQAIIASYLRNNTVMPTHVTAFAAFAALRKSHPEGDLYRFLRNTGPDFSIPLTEVLRGIEELVTALRELEAAGGIHLEESLHRQNPRETFDDAIARFAGHEEGETLLCERERVWSEDLKLLYYYRNRLDPYGFKILT